MEGDSLTFSWRMFALFGHIQSPFNGWGFFPAAASSPTFGQYKEAHRHFKAQALIGAGDMVSIPSLRAAPSFRSGRSDARCASPENHGCPCRVRVAESRRITRPKLRLNDDLPSMRKLITAANARTNRMQATARSSSVVFMVVSCSPSPDPCRSAEIPRSRWGTVPSSDAHRI